MKKNVGIKSGQTGFVQFTRFLIMVFLFQLFLFGTKEPVFAQTGNTKLSGLVKDEEGIPIPGVTVVVKGTTLGTITSNDGKYVLESPQSNGILVFTFIGLQKEELPFAGAGTFNITMKSTPYELDEIIAVGYGTQKKSHLTGAVAAVDMQAVQNLPLGSMSALLQGQIPGVSVSGGTSRPGDNASITIRNPINLSKDGGTLRPLYVIDDVVKTEDDFNVLDVSQVENVSLLKDASAAIYGARANQGVVIVKTKRGKKGAEKISYSGSFGTADAMMSPKMMNGYEQAVYLNDLKIAEGKPTDPSIYSADELEHFKNNNYNWLDMAWKPAYVTRHAVSISGGTEKATYFAGVSYNYQNANFDNINANKWTFRASSDMQLTDGLKLGLSVSGDLSKKQMYFLKQGGENVENDMKSLLYTPQFNPPYVNGLPVLLSNSSNTNTIDAFHFFEVQKSNNYTMSRNNGLNINANLEYDIPFVKGLKAKVVYNKAMYNTFGKQFGTKYNLYALSMQGDNKHIYAGDVIKTVSLSNGDRVRINPSYTDSYQVNGSLAYEGQFGKHQISALALFEQSESHSDGVAGMMEGVIVGGSDNMKYATGTATVSETEGETGSLSYVGRINYSYDNKYLAEFTVRADASTKFAPENRWGYFPSLSLGWTISEEKFFKDNVEFIDYLKFRGSGGLMGGDATKAFNWLTSYSIQTGKAAVFGGNGDRGLVVTPQTTMANRNIRWDNKLSYNFGIDSYFLNKRLSFNADAFYDHRYDMLTTLTSSVPLMIGVALPSENFGIVDGYGFEISLGWKDKIGKDWKYNVTTFFAWNDNKQIKVDVAKGIIGTYKDPNGNSSDMGFEGLHCLGMFRTQQEVDAYVAKYPKYTIYGKAPAPGMLYFEDIKGAKDATTNLYAAPDGIIDDNDMSFLTKKKDNHYNLGLNYGVSYKGLSLSVVMGCSFGGQSSVEGTAFKQATLTSNRPDFWADHWTPENTNAKYPNPYYKETYDRATDFWFRNSFTCSMKSFNLSYQVPATVAHKVGLNSMNVFIVGTNPINFYNPYGYKNGSGAFDAYPTLRTFSLGINVDL